MAVIEYDGYKQKLRAMDDTSYITPEQEAALRQFFADFSLEANTELKERFLRLWNIMADIYDDLQATMRADGVLYDGALQRDVAERLRVSRYTVYKYMHEIEKESENNILPDA